MPKKKTNKTDISGCTLESLQTMAREYSIDNNALFCGLISQYALQFSVIEKMKAAVESDATMTTEKCYLKGQTNMYASPLVRELPKHCDALNRTASMILDVIIKLGHKAPEKGNLAKKLDEDE